MAIRTHVFIDGYNLYYGRLRGTPYKWLDLVALMQNIVRIQDGSYVVQHTHYFTAPAKEAFATHGKDSVIAQQSYHRALQAQYPPSQFRMTLGDHTFDKSGALMPVYVQGVKCDKANRVRVWKLEEKQTDVNLALAMYRECCKGTCDQVVVCSNDSDVEPVLRAIRDDFPEMLIGVVTPKSPGSEDRRFSTSLAAHAHWVRRHITDSELEAAQLAPQVPTAKKPAKKPPHW